MVGKRDMTISRVHLDLTGLTNFYDYYYCVSLSKQTYAYAKIESVCFHYIKRSVVALRAILCHGKVPL